MLTILTKRNIATLGFIPAACFVVSCTETAFESVQVRHADQSTLADASKSGDVSGVEATSTTATGDETQVPATDEGTKADFPEPVSGAYLACVVTDAEAAGRQAIGCNLHSREPAAILDPAKYATGWTVTGVDGAAVAFEAALSASGAFRVIIWVSKEVVHAVSVSATLASAGQSATVVTRPVSPLPAQRLVCGAFKGYIDEPGVNSNFDKLVITDKSAGAVTTPAQVWVEGYLASGVPSPNRASYPVNVGGANGTERVVVQIGSTEFRFILDHSTKTTNLCVYPLTLTAGPTLTP